MNTGKGQHIQKQYDMRIQKMTTRIYEYRKRSAHTKKYDMRIQKITTGIYEHRKRSAYTKTIWYENTENYNRNI